MHTREEKNGVAKEAIVLQWVAWTASCDFKPVKKMLWKMLLFCVKTIVKESRKF